MMGQGVRGAILAVALLLGLGAEAQDVGSEAATGAGYGEWIEGFRGRAVAQGIPAATVEAALEAARFLPDVVARDRNQSEFTKALHEYMAVAVSEARVEAGQRALRENAGLLEAIERETGVDREIVVAIWGMESSYGGFRGDIPAISALSTLAYEGRRARFFEDQLLAALRILAAGDTTAEALRGSWAGAMGHTQFMPTSFEAHAVDWDGDGRRDIWGDDPADALASTARYLADAGWVQGQPWGVEVVLPPGFDFALARANNRQSTDYWAALGVRDVEGAVVPDQGGAVILVPAGAGGPAFMTFRNFNALERYNTADAYVIGVGHLADRLRGGPPLRARWPEDRALTGAERIELQERLTALGFDTLGVDGRIGPRTVAAVRNWQRANGEVPDGYPSPAVLERLRG